MNASESDLPTTSAIGRRIQAAREARGLTQAELGRRLGIASHQSVSELEQGNRRLQPDELVKLAEVLDRDIDYFIDPFSLAEEAQYSWRRAPGMPEESVTAFSARADRLVALLRWLRLSDENARDPLKSTLRLSDQSSFEAAHRAGELLVDKLGLGPVPAEQLLEKVEQRLDIPVLFVDIGDKNAISGATVHLSDFTCILINRNEPPARRTFDLAHELFHVLTWEVMPPAFSESNAIEIQGAGRAKRIEQMANRFAASLLMPRTLIEAKLTGIDVSKLEELRALATYFGVSPSALAWRLFSLQRISSATRDTLKSAPTALEQQSNPQPKPYSGRFISLLARALNEGRLSPRKGAKLLGLNLDEFDSLFAQYGLEAPY
jgi:Zn-dependent peptidase ImmA (M78 family)/transcriptional regulator with XRE-family HTH domain